MEENLKRAEPDRIGGWLILVALGVVISAFYLLLNLYVTFDAIFSDGTWESLTNKESASYAAYWAPIIIGELAVNIVFVVLWSYLACLLFLKRKEFPIWYFGVTLFTITFIIVDAYIISMFVEGVEFMDSETIRELGRPLVSLLIWCPYLFISQRSKRTFVVQKFNHRLNQDMPATG